MERIHGKVLLSIIISFFMTVNVMKEKKKKRKCACVFVFQHLRTHLGTHFLNVSPIFGLQSSQNPCMDI